MKTLIIEQIITFIDNKTQLDENNIFEYFIPSINKYAEIPDKTRLFLIQWKDTIIKNSTWISREEIERNQQQIDPNNIFKKFIEKNTVDGVLYQPVLTKSIQAKDLVPEKIISMKMDENNNELYEVKWRYNEKNMYTFEQKEFFNDTYNKMLLDQFNNQYKPNKSNSKTKKNEKETNKYLSECTDISSIIKKCSLKETSTHEMKELTEAFELITKNNNVWIKFKDDDGNECRHYQMKLVLMQMLQLLMEKQYKGPYLIVADEDNYDLYRRNLHRFIPQAYATFIPSYPETDEEKEQIEKELYDSTTGHIKSTFVVTTLNGIYFKENTLFDLVIVDADPAVFFKGKWKVKLNHFLLMYDGKYNEQILQTYCSNKKIGNLVSRKRDYWIPPIQYVDCYIDLNQTQRMKYDNLGYTIKTNQKQADIILDEMKKLLIYPPLFDRNIETHGTKYEGIMRIIQVFGQLRNVKIAILCDYDLPLRKIAEKTSANVIDSIVNIERTKAICQMIACKTETEAKTIAIDYNDKLKKKGYTKENDVLANERIVCVHNGCFDIGLDLSPIDVVIDMSNDYTPLYESNLRNKYLIATQSNIISFNLSSNETIEEITQSMNELDVVLTKEQQLEIYFESLKNYIYQYGFTKTKDRKLNAKDFAERIGRFANSHSSQLVIDIKRNDFFAVEGFKKRGYIYLKNYNQEEQEKKQQKEYPPLQFNSHDASKQSKHQSDSFEEIEIDTAEKPIQMEEEKMKENEPGEVLCVDLSSAHPISHKQAKTKHQPSIVTNKERIRQKHPELFEKKSVEMVNKQTTPQPSPYEMKQQQLKNITPIENEPLIVGDDLDSITSEDDETTQTFQVVNKFNPIFKKYIPFITYEKTSLWLVTFISTIQRYGKNVHYWNDEVREQFVPLSKTQIQQVVDELMNHEDFDNEAKQKANMMELFINVFNYIESQKGILPECATDKCKHWDSSCDVNLVSLIVQHGLNVPELYLNNIVMKGVLDISGVKTDQKKMEFLTERTEQLFNHYSNLQLI